MLTADRQHSRASETKGIWVIFELLPGLPHGKASFRLLSGNSAAPRQEGGGEGFEE